jgi:cell division protein FtsI (penicillin-binding protein 3)
VSENAKQNKAALKQMEGRMRLAIVFGGLIVLAIGVVGRLVWVQILSAEEYRRKAQRQYEFKETVAALRGDITDRNGKRLAASLTSISFAADPKMVEDKESLAALCAHAFGKPKEYYLKKLNEKTRFVWLERNQPPSSAEALLSLDIEGLIVRKEAHRQYENLASQVIGFVDADNNGISGLEKQLDKYLRGKDGFLTMQRTATGKAFPAIGAPREEPIPGCHVELTIDADVQAIVEDELQQGLLKSGASAGIAIVMNVHTGEILAMANAPDFDMNSKATYTPDATRNRAVTDAFEPGSTFKLIVATAATQHGIVKPYDKVNAENGRYTVQNRVITDHERFGVIDLQRSNCALEQCGGGKNRTQIRQRKILRNGKGIRLWRKNLH